MTKKKSHAHSYKMSFRLWHVLAAIPILISGTSHAMQFTVFEARGFAMGGTGVASAQYAAAAFYNPALLAVTTESNHVSFIIPAAGVDVSGNDGAVKAIQDINGDNALDKLTSAANAFTTAYNACKASGCSNSSSLMSASDQVANAAGTVNADLNKLSGKEYRVSAGGGLAIALPKWTYKAALSAYVEGYSRAVPVVDSQDMADLQTVISGAKAYAASGQPSALSSFVDANGNLTVNSRTIGNNNEDYRSNIGMVGVVIGNVGLSLAKQFGSDQGGWLFGITPKVQKIRTVAYTASVDSNNFDVNKNELNSSGFNADMGVAKTFSSGSLEHVRLGLVMRNVMAQTYKTVDPTQNVKLEPQVRAGASWSSKYATLTTDLDLTANKFIGGSESSQMLAIGGEVSAWNFLKLRAGYREDIKAKYGALTGGVSLLGVQVSGIYAKDREAGVMAQFGGTF